MITALIGLVAAGAAAIAIAGRPGRQRAVAMAVAAVLAAALIAADQWHAAQLVELRNSPGLLAVALVAVAALTAGGAYLFLRHPAALPVLAVVALPFRVPVGVGGADANLLLPLYLVMAAGVAAALWREFTAAPGPAAGSTGNILTGAPPAEDSSRSGSPVAADQARGETAVPGRISGWLLPLLAASVVVYAIGILWSEDRSAGLLNLCFFLVPFSVVFALVSEVRWDRRRLTLIATVILGMALLCAVIGLAEWGSRSLFWNQAVIRSNDFHVYFRVNSLFWDPNVFGRYLALAITIAAAALAWARRPREIGLLSVCAVVLWLGLLVTYSQSSFIALLAGLAALAAIRWSVRAVAGGLVVLAVAAFLFGTFAGGVIKLDLGALNKQTSGRANLVEGGIDLFENRPVYGYGSGAFSAAFKREVAGPDAPVTESHTEPVTVAAERGLFGLVFYLALIVAALATLTTGFRRVMPGLGAAGATDPVRGPPAARAAVFACFIAVLLHTLTYAGFLDDPVTWVLLAIGYGLATPCRDI